MRRRVVLMIQAALVAGCALLRLLDRSKSRPRKCPVVTLMWNVSLITRVFGQGLPAMHTSWKVTYGLMFQCLSALRTPDGCVVCIGRVCAELGRRALCAELLRDVGVASLRLTQFFQPVTTLDSILSLINYHMLTVAQLTVACEVNFQSRWSRVSSSACTAITTTMTGRTLLAPVVV